MTQEPVGVAKYLPKLDEYDLEWIRSSLNVKAMEINQFKSVVLALIEKVESLEKARHTDALNRQKDVVKIGELSIERDELKKTNQSLLDRVTELEKRMNNAAECIAKIEKMKGQK